MKLRPAKGAALRQHIVVVRFESGCKPGAKQDNKLHHRVAEVRRLLRTDKSIEMIAEDLGVFPTTLRGFIKRRNLCNMKDRAAFISLQASLKKLDASV
jgi:hypothetical protein